MSTFQALLFLAPTYYNSDDLKLLDFPIHFLDMQSGTPTDNLNYPPSQYFAHPYFYPLPYSAYDPYPHYPQEYAHARPQSNILREHSYTRPQSNILREHTYSRPQSNILRENICSRPQSNILRESTYSRPQSSVLRDPAYNPPRSTSPIAGSGFPPSFRDLYPHHHHCLRCQIRSSEEGSSSSNWNSALRDSWPVFEGVINPNLCPLAPEYIPWPQIQPPNSPQSSNPPPSNEIPPPTTTSTPPLPQARSSPSMSPPLPIQTSAPTKPSPATWSDLFRGGNLSLPSQTSASSKAT